MAKKGGNVVENMFFVFLAGLTIGMAAGYFVAALMYAASSGDARRRNLEDA